MNICPTCHLSGNITFNISFILLEISPKIHFLRLDKTRFQAWFLIFWHPSPEILRSQPQNIDWDVNPRFCMKSEIRRLDICITNIRDSKRGIMLYIFVCRIYFVLWNEHWNYIYLHCYFVLRLQCVFSPLFLSKFKQQFLFSQAKIQHS